MDRSAMRHPKIYSFNYVATYESEDVQLKKFLGPYFEDFLSKFLIFTYILNYCAIFCVLATVLLKIEDYLFFVDRLVL